MKKLMIKLAARFGFVPAEAAEDWEQTARTFCGAFMDAADRAKKAEAKAEDAECKAEAWRKSYSRLEADTLDSDSFLDEATAKGLGVGRDAVRAAWNRLTEVALAYEYAEEAVRRFERWFNRLAAETGKPPIGPVERLEVVNAVAKELEGKVEPGCLQYDCEDSRIGSLVQAAESGRAAMFGKVVEDRVTALYRCGRAGWPLAHLAKHLVPAKKKADVLTAEEAAVWGHLSSRAKDELDRAALSGGQAAAWDLAKAIVRGLVRMPDEPNEPEEEATIEF